MEVDQELLKKAKQKKSRRIVIIVVVLLFLASIFAALKITGSPVLPGGTKSCTIEITCAALSEDMSALTNKALKDYIPEDGVILPPTEYSFEKGKSVYDALADTCKANKVHMESKYESVYGSYYVKGIGHLYEFDAGPRSGWLFKVNGKNPDYGAGKVELQEGDQILWYFVPDYTKDSSMKDVEGE